MWELNHKEDWMLKNWCFWIVVLEQNFENPLDSKKIKPVNPKGNQSWIFTGRTNAEAESLILWPPEVKNQLTGKDPDLGKDWRQEEKGQQRTEVMDGILSQWTWVSANSGRWWRLGKHAAVHRSQRFWHYWATEQHMLSTNSTVLPLLFQFGYFVFFLLSDCCGEFFQYYLNTIGKTGHPYLVPEFNKKAFNFSLLTITLWVCCKSLSLCWDMFPLHPLGWEFLLWIKVEFYQMLFLQGLR